MQSFKFLLNFSYSNIKIWPSYPIEPKYQPQSLAAVVNGPGEENVFCLAENGSAKCQPFSNFPSAL
jgi:hypothetical protein